MPLLLKDRDGAFWAGARIPEWVKDPDQALRFEEAERYAIRHNNTLWRTVMEKPKDDQ